ncbi:MAG: thioredoxin-dependent thiol peroxidase [Bacteroidales bacterium]|uniref:thioredoxin-dependent thiol peroxidase n=1 Tax=Porphyromonas sp. TaxID=1924944 RepID=UPI0029794928|nr:thioredoxin-dependent thiol peroxidase [Porphyromonas sp.]MDD7437461.1 thioredoxin-dependent thiol peroxidase [Bacteroidales bacterium]MDY3067492.1 thioredoxin-dependent thiol peroxidase [Porphyromonas sp.]
MIKVGDKIPERLGVDQNGNEITRNSLAGQRVVLYFYPKDNTSGCTEQACSLRDGISDLKDAGYTVIGVSKDSARSHKGFIEKYSLPFPLIADTETELNQAFGVWVEKSMYGRKYMGTQRTTFVIDGEGIVQAVVSGKEIKTKEHAAQLIQMINKLDK